MQPQNHACRFEEIFKTKLQASGRSDPETLRSQKHRRFKIRLLVKGLKVVHGQLGLTKQIESLRVEPAQVAARGGLTPATRNAWPDFQKCAHIFCGVLELIDPKSGPGFSPSWAFAPRSIDTARRPALDLAGRRYCRNSCAQ
jgi:hypothetical protein